MTLRTTVLAVVLAGSAWAEDATVCVSKVPARSHEPVMNPDASKASSSYRVRVDALPWQVVDATHAPRFDGLSRSGSHTVRVAIGKKTIESFKFSFEARENKRLFVRSDYFTWTLADDDCR